MKSVLSAFLSLAKGLSLFGNVDHFSAVVYDASQLFRFRYYNQMISMSLCIAPYAGYDYAKVDSPLICTLS